MKKSIGNKKIKTAIFISGRGSNLKNLIKFSNQISSPISIKLIVSNNKKAKGLRYADQDNIEKKIINFSNPIIAEKKILSLLVKKKIKFICLAGFMKILSKKFINNYKGKILNIHPSLLPKYKGLNTHKRVIMNKEKFTGCTVHMVNSKLDSGKIIFQKKIKVLKNDNEKKLEKRLLNIENRIYPIATKKFINFNL